MCNGYCCRNRLSYRSGCNRLRYRLLNCRRRYRLRSNRRRCSYRLCRRGLRCSRLNTYGRSARFTKLILIS